ncbi:Bifunctional protein GlmU [Novipirellula galeiformis]|uniref:Bifunctional protein GlmU n=1 Tax=Novipirellula galeiformis TaxID=2528004 RepID=A0A5C6CTI0_9BACT|nr:glycosyltransferase family 2 protein [Novipirellula galeiformis]TWU26346.1 Bifunctional protein GlmU [Novipirellula galeiformis]
MLNIVIPMAGRGSRFQQAGYDIPKPLIPVHGVPMIQTVIENVRPQREHRFIFICQAQHLESYELEKTLKQSSPDCEIVSVEGVTQGAACTVLLAKEWIDNEQPLMIANCDQWIDYSIDDYLSMGDADGVEGLVMTMKDDSPKWSYVQRDAQGEMQCIVEKEVVSDEATVGIYNFARGNAFVAAAFEMIEANERSKNEFYVAPVYSRLIRNGAKIATDNVGDAGNVMYGLGTPEDLERFLTLGFASRIQSSNRKLRTPA